MLHRKRGRAFQFYTRGRTELGRSTLDVPSKNLGGFYVLGLKIFN